MDASGGAGGPWLMRIEKPGIGAVRVGPGLDWSGRELALERYGFLLLFLWAVIGFSFSALYTIL